MTMEDMDEIEDGPDDDMFFVWLKVGWWCFAMSVSQSSLHQHLFIWLTSLSEEPSDKSFTLCEHRIYRRIDIRRRRRTSLENAFPVVFQLA